MANSPNPAPAGAESAPTQPADMSVLDMPWEGDPEQPSDDSAEPEGRHDDPAEPTEPDADAPPEGEPNAEDDEGQANEEPEDDASEPEPDDIAKPKASEKDSFLVSRDGEKVPTAELWAARDKVREFDRVLPQIQQTHQRFEQEQQQFHAEKQQFDTYAKQVAEVALGFLPSEPDRALMDPNGPAYDPWAYQAAKFARDTAVEDFNRKFQAVAQAQQQSTQASTQEAEKQRTTLRQNAVQQFFGAHPELQAPEKQQAFVQDFHTVADAVGFSREERQDVLDPRLYRLTMLAARGLKAMEADKRSQATTSQRQAIAAKKVAGAPPVAPPAARQSAGVRDARVQAASLERLRKSGSAADAEDFLSRFQ